MPRFVAFLRALNTGKNRTVTMTSLRNAFESLGFSGVSTVFVSGNIVFETNAVDTSLLESQIQFKLHETLGFEIKTFIRTAPELAAITACKPFPQSEVEAAAEFNVIFLAAPLDEISTQKLIALAYAENEFRVLGREIYWLRHKRPDKPTFSTVPLANAIRNPFTIRTMKMITKIVLKYCS